MDFYGGSYNPKVLIYSFGVSISLMKENIGRYLVVVYGLHAHQVELSR